jgi:hypothetical protein
LLIRVIHSDTLYKSLLKRVVKITPLFRGWVKTSNVTVGLCEYLDFTNIKDYQNKLNNRFHFLSKKVITVFLKILNVKNYFFLLKNIKKTMFFFSKKYLFMVKLIFKEKL